VASFRNQDEARLLAGRLQAEGIEARIFPDPDFSLYGRDSVSMLGQPIEVLVPQEQVGQAERVIDEVGQAR
jgi:hypothetical protein